MYVLTIETEFGTMFLEFDKIEEASLYANYHKHVWPQDCLRIDGPDVNISLP